MEVQKVKRTARAPMYGVAPVGKGAGDPSARSFQSALQEQFTSQYRSRAAALFDEIAGRAPAIAERADLDEFEKYRALIGELLNEVVANAYAIHSECLADSFGKQRVYTTIRIIDSKLESLAADLLDRNGGRLDMLGRIDEIRGLVMDLLY